MSMDAHRAQAELAVQAAAAVAYPGVPVSFENVPFTQPETAWMKVYLVEGRSFVVNLGRGRQIDRHTGYVQVDVLIPENTGSSPAIKMAEWAGTIFRLQNISLADNSVVRYRVPATANHGIQSGMFRCTMRIPFWRDEVPA
jgi:hypothetical protein